MTSHKWPNLWPTLSAPLPDPALRVLSLGAGVQSTTLALAAARGEVGPMPDCAIFSDPGFEGKKVYRHLQWLTSVVPFPVYEVANGNLREAIFNPVAGQRFPAIPFFIRNPDGTTGLGGRQCTSAYKLEPVTRHIRKLLGVGPRSPIKPDSVEVWIGISQDEVVRMRPAKQKFIRNRWPLIEAGFERRHCEKWLMDRQYSAPRSACICCPFRTNKEWRAMRDNEPDEFAEACAADLAIRTGGSTSALAGEQFIHRSLVPLSEADIESDDDPRQFGFDLDCEGMCGV